MKRITDEEIEAVEEPCLKDEQCPFGVADEPVNADPEVESAECVLCHERTVAQAQLKSCEAERPEIERKAREKAFKEVEELGTFYYQGEVKPPQFELKINGNKWKALKEGGK